jgi:hypothetical protein
LKHGILGTAPSTLAARKQKESQQLSKENSHGSGAVVAKKTNGRPKKAVSHPVESTALQTQPREGKTRAAVILAEQPSSSIDTSVSTTLGEVRQLCRVMAYEFGLPERIFTARLAQLLYASTVR